MTFATHLTNARLSDMVTLHVAKGRVGFESLKSSRRMNRASKTRFNYVQAQRDTFGYTSYGFRGHWSFNLLSLGHPIESWFSGLTLSPRRTAMSANQNAYPNTNRRKFLTNLSAAPIAISAPNIVLADAPLDMSAHQKQTFVWATYGLWQDGPAALPEPSAALEQVQRLTFDFYRDWGMSDPCKPENYLTNFYVLRWAEQRGIAV